MPTDTPIYLFLSISYLSLLNEWDILGLPALKEKTCILFPSVICPNTWAYCLPHLYFDVLLCIKSFTSEYNSYIPGKKLNLNQIYVLKIFVTFNFYFWGLRRSFKILQVPEFIDSIVFHYWLQTDYFYFSDLSSFLQYFTKHSQQKARQSITFTLPMSSHGAKSSLNVWSASIVTKSNNITECFIKTWCGSPCPQSLI